MERETSLEAEKNSIIDNGNVATYYSINWMRYYYITET